jgi:hypothetical protein
MKRSTRKLTLNRETLRNMNTGELAEAAGGASSPRVSCYIACFPATNVACGTAVTCNLYCTAAC